MISPLAECVVGVSFQANADVQSMGRKQPESKWVLIRNQLIGFSSSSLSAGYQFFDAESNVEHVTNKRATRLTHTALNDPLKLIGSDCRWLCYLFFFPPVKKSSNAPPRYLPAPRLSARVTSAGVLVVRLKKKKERECIRSHVWCLPHCLRGRVGEDNTVLHAQTTVVSCQQSSQSSLKTNFLLVSWEEVWGFGGQCRAVKQNQALYHGFYLQCSAACCQFLSGD